ncbi:hypothetical protein Bca52824_035437 [Brassica carinata]|uniref:Uncharacterized protein n=1 Tax=Brassica carinata TaxID=52824 RepID=A0A8X7V0J1_BRACI|nr:hypothetical protein Bca52824_035437 [Brassica carinata]
MKDKPDPTQGSSSIQGGNLGYAAIEDMLSAVETESLPLVGPLSVIGVEEVASWRQRDQLPDYVVTRLPGRIDRVSEMLEISPGQLNPPSWRTLIAMQNLGDLEGLVIGVSEVLYSYFISPLNGAEGRYHLHPRLKEPPVQEIPKKERKRHLVFESYWTEKFAFMYLSGFSPIWCVAGGL